jgi:hypothetical protein
MISLAFMVLILKPLVESSDFFLPNTSFALVYSHLTIGSYLVLVNKIFPKLDQPQKRSVRRRIERIMDE